MRAIVIVVDALPLPMLGPYGGHWIETPALDRFAFDATVFDNCHPERPGPDAWRQLNPFAAGDPLAEESLSLARALASVNVPAAVFTNRRKEREHCPPRSGHPGPIEVFGAGGRIELTFAECDTWIEHCEGQPCYCFLNLQVGFADWTPADRFLRQAEAAIGERPLMAPPTGFSSNTQSAIEMALARTLLAARIAEFDRALEHFLKNRRADGGRDDTLIALMAESGYPLGEHGKVGLAIERLYEEIEHVPLIVQSPAGRPAARSSALLQASDVGAAIRGFFGLGSELTKESAAAILSGKPSLGRPFAVARRGIDEAAIRTADWKLLVSTRAENPKPAELYAKPMDRWERQNLASQFPDVVDDLAREIDAS